MGGASSVENNVNNQFTDTLEFYASQTSQQFGQFKIYKMKQKPYEAIMAKTFIVSSNDTLIDKKQEWYKKFKPDKNVIKLDLIRLTEKQENCGKHKQLSLFCRYYFFTLRDAINRKVQRKSKFTEHEIYYIAKTLISLYEYIHEQNNNYWGFFKSKYLFLTPQGFLKIYPWIHEWAEPQQQNTLNESQMSVPHNEHVIHLAREKRESFGNFKTFHDDLVDIGVILMEMVNLGKEEDYKKQNHLKSQIISFLLNSYTDSSKSCLHIYKNLLRGMLPQKKENIWKLQMIKYELDKIGYQHGLKQIYCVKFSDPDSDSCEITVQSDNWQESKQRNLKMLASSKKLRAEKISIVKKHH